MPTRAIRTPTHEKPAPEFVRLGPEHARELAQTLFLRGERVDMQALATRLGIGRATVYRWCGSREELIGEILARLSELTWTIAAQQAEGEGSGRALDTIRRFMTLTAEFQPLREFAERETQVALRVLFALDGAVSQCLRSGVRRALLENAVVDPAELTPELVEIIVRVGTALEWTPVAIGEPPEIDRAMALIETLLV